MGLLPVMGKGWKFWKTNRASEPGFPGGLAGATPDGKATASGLAVSLCNFHPWL